MADTAIMPINTIEHDTSLLRLLQLASPSLPVGAYSYSEGLEYAVHIDRVKDAATLRAWLEDGLHYGSALLDAAVVCRVYEARQRGDGAAVQQWNCWLTASRESEELRQQSHDMGRALLRLLRDLKPSVPDCVSWRDEPCNFATAYALAAVHWDIPCSDAIVGYLQGWAANLMSAGIKLIPLGQTAGQQMMWDLQIAIRTAAISAISMTDDKLGVGGWGMALASMAHETQYTRLFRS